MISASMFTIRRVFCAWMLLALFVLLPHPEVSAQPVPSGVTYAVTTLVDEIDTTLAPGFGAGTSLREAVAHSASGDSIVFDAGLTGTIFLDLGEILIPHDLIIVGPGLDVLEVNGNDLTRIFTLDTSIALSMSRLTLASGRAVDGAAIRSFGWLSIENSALRWSTAIQRGGAIYHEGSTLKLTQVRIEHCEAYQYGGAIAAIAGTLALSGSTLSQNTAGGNGGAIAATADTVSLSGSTLSQNSAGGNGGALWVSAGVAATIAHCSLSENTAVGSGGGAAASIGSSLHITASTMNDNQAQNGGGLFNAGTLSLLNSTISGNTAHGFGGGLRNSGTADMDFTTVAFNTAAQGGGVYDNSAFTTKRSLFAENSAASGPDVRGAITSAGNNLVAIRNGSTGWNNVNDLTGTASAPMTAALDELRLNGGSTKTHALLVCSRAIDAANSTGTAGMTDQRGVTRSLNGDKFPTALPDIGAYEVPSALDNTPPTINGHPSFRVFLDSAGNATITKDTVLLSAYDDCGILSTAVSKTVFSCADVGTVSLTLTATDRSGNVSTQGINVEVVDVTPPVLMVPSDVTVSASAVSCDITLSAAQLGTASATDACGTVTIINNAPSSFPVGTTIVNYIATDANGNQAAGVQTVTVNDNTNPSITAPAALILGTQPGQCAIPLSQVTLGNPTVSDNCTYTVTNDAPASFPLGTTTVTWSVVDASGNTNSATQDVTVEDVVPPVLFAPADLTLVADTGSCARDSASVSLGTPTYTDNCSAVTISNDKPASFPIGETTVIWTATDAAGNIDSAAQKILVFDASPPSVVAPPDIEVQVDSGSCAWTVDPTILGTATSYDNCGIPSVANSAGASLPAGTHRVIWSVLDANGNRATDVQIVTVVGEPPVISCPSSITTNTDPGMPGAVVTWLPPTAGSGCADVEIIRTGGLGSGDFFPVGVTTVSYMAIDPSNQIATCSFDVTVEDHEAPQIAVSMAPEYLWPANNQWEAVIATVEVMDNVPGASAVLTSITGNQNITGDVADTTTGVLDLMFDLRAKNVLGPRVYTITYTATDVAGNKTVGSATVTVPTQKPKDFESEDLPVPLAVTLEQNYPNPFNPTTLISFGTPREQHLELRIYNAMGVPVRTLVNTTLAAGQYTVQWDGRDDGGGSLPSGVYLYMLLAGDSHVQRKMILTQ